jgi:hypothetical protein
VVCTLTIAGNDTIRINIRALVDAWWTRHTIYKYRPGGPMLLVRRVRGRWRTLAQVRTLNNHLTQEEKNAGYHHCWDEE